jgi:hypothetical protein
VQPEDAVPPPKAQAELEPVSLVLAAGRRRSRVVRILRWVAAVLLVLVGMSMVVVPGIPGPPFFLLALLLVASDFAPARRLAVRMQRRIPIARRALPKRLRRLGRKDRG